MIQRGAIERALEGVLIPTRWGPAGEVLGLGLMTFDEHEYVIDTTAYRGHRLLEHLREHVRLSAILLGDRVIELRGFEVLGGRTPGET